VHNSEISMMKKAATKRFSNPGEAYQTIKNRAQGGVFGALALGGVPVVFIEDIAYTLSFIHAWSVLNDALNQLKNENHFRCEKQFTLKPLLKASKKALPPTAPVRCYSMPRQERRRIRSGTSRSCSFATAISLA
jgi:hypothetical protein